jgi:hypothetical protein
MNRAGLSSEILLPRARSSLRSPRRRCECPCCSLPSHCCGLAPPCCVTTLWSHPSMGERRR